MSKVEYTVGTFLTETDIIVHQIPEEIIDIPKLGIKKQRTHSFRTRQVNRKSEQTTKKNKQKDVS